MQRNTPITPNEDGKGGNEKKKTDRVRTGTRASLVRDDMDRVFDDRFWVEPFDFFRNLPSQLRRSAFPRVDVSESDTEVKVIADIPGVDPDDMYIDVRDNRMILKGRVNRETETDPSSRPYKYERLYGEFRREFPLPSPVDEEKVRAVYRNGILTVTAPKSENASRSRIRIERG